ncbi:MAG: 50S ribosomal protein P1 [Candidatus Micrarchaeota archaeon]|nr:50S ribosomal protein P1 [Candidatus Micrarchaeota archaeon]
MEYIHAALLLHSAKKEITETNVVSVLKAAGIAADTARAKALVSSLQGVNIEEAVAKAAAPVAVAAAPAAVPAAGAEKKKEPKDEKKSEEEAAAGLASLFG